MGCNVSTGISTINYNTTFNNQTSHYLDITSYVVNINSSFIQLISANTSNIIPIQGLSSFIIEFANTLNKPSISFIQGIYGSKSIVINENAQENTYTLNYYKVINSFGSYQGVDQIDILM